MDSDKIFTFVVFVINCVALFFAAYNLGYKHGEKSNEK